MPRQLTNSLFNSLRGRIWISTSVLAFFVTTFGLISYLVVSLVISDLFYGIFIPFLFLAFVVVIFGWWLSNEIVSPIEKVTLLSKSLERNSSSTLPKTSGSYETDELLQSLFRNSQQMQIVVSLMEDVAAGQVDVSLSPLEGSDHLSTTFKKLLERVVESVNAKNDLDELRAAVDRLKRDTTALRSGNLGVKVSVDDPHTREIAGVIRYLGESLSVLVGTIRSDTSKAHSEADGIYKTLQTVIENDERRGGKLQQASLTIKQVPNLVRKISDNLENSVQTAQQSIERVRRGSEIAEKSSGAAAQLRKRMREGIKRVQNLNERTQEIGRVANTIEDLANRTNMIALNASIQATELGEKGHGFALVAEEVERIASRASGANRQIAVLSNNLSAEIKKIEAALDSTNIEVSSLSKVAIEGGNILGEIERHIAQFLNLQENLLAVSGERSEETEEAFQTFLDSIGEGEQLVDDLRASSVHVADLARLIKGLRASVSEFRLVRRDTENETQEAEGEDAARDAVHRTSAGDGSHLAPEPNNTGRVFDASETRAADAGEDHASPEPMAEDLDSEPDLSPYYASGNDGDSAPRKDTHSGPGDQPLELG